MASAMRVRMPGGTGREPARSMMPAMPHMTKFREAATRSGARDDAKPRSAPRRGFTVIMRPALAKTRAVPSLIVMPSDKINLVTGATGQLGSHIVEQLRLQGETVRVLVRPGRDRGFLQSQG